MLSDRPFYTLVSAGPAAPAQLRLSHRTPGTYHLELHRTGFRHNDPLSAYVDIGLPDWLLPAPLATLDQLTQDRPEQDQTVRVPATGGMTLPVTMQTHDVVLVTLTAVT